MLSKLSVTLKVFFNFFFFRKILTKIFFSKKKF